MLTVDRKALITELEWVKRVMDKKTTVPVLAQIKVSTRDSFLYLQATNLELASFTNIEGIEGSGVAETFECCVPPQKFIDYLKCVKSEQVNLNVKDTGVEVAHLTGAACISGMSAESYPSMPPTPEFQFYLGDLKTISKRAVVSISREESRFTLDGALLVAKEGKVSLVSTDGHRMGIQEITAVRFFGEHPQQVRVLLPKDALIEAANINGGTSLFGCNEEYSVFAYGTRVIVSRNLHGNFPDYERVIPKETKESATVDKALFADAVKQAAIFADDSHAPKIALQMKESGTINVYASTADLGSAGSEVDTSVQGQSWTVGVNASYLLDFLNGAGATVSIAAGPTEKDALTFQDTDWTYILMPARLK